MPINADFHGHTCPCAAPPLHCRLEKNIALEELYLPLEFCCDICRYFSDGYHHSEVFIFCLDGKQRNFTPDILRLKHDDFINRLQLAIKHGSAMVLSVFANYVSLETMMVIFSLLIQNFSLKLTLILSTLWVKTFSWQNFR